MSVFTLAQPQSLDQVLSFLGQEKEGYFLLAGGTDILGEIKKKNLSPQGLIDLKTINGLAEIRIEKQEVQIGALTTLNSLITNQYIREFFPGLVEAAHSIGTPQLRNAGTVGGNLCQRPRCWYFRDPDVICRKKGGSRCYAYQGRNRYHAIWGGRMCYIVHPSDLAPMLIALQAEVVLATSQGQRRLPLEEFFILPQQNVRQENILAKNEVLKEIIIPLPKDKEKEKSTYLKLRERGSWDFALVSVAVWMIKEGNLAKDLQIVLGGVAPKPWRLTELEESLRGENIDTSLIDQALKKVLATARPLKENEYKIDLVKAGVITALQSLA